MRNELAFDHALRLHQQRRFQEAERLYCQILDSEPNHSSALHLLGVVRHQQGDHAAAIGLIGRAIALNPHLADISLNDILGSGAIPDFALSYHGRNQ